VVAIGEEFSGWDWVGMIVNVGEHVLLLHDISIWEVL
jgi:hypothetical protein